MVEINQFVEKMQEEFSEFNSYDVLGRDSKAPSAQVSFTGVNKDFVGDNKGEIMSKAENLGWEYDDWEVLNGENELVRVVFNKQT